MTSRVKLLLAAGLILFPVTLFALPQVAVLDAVVPEDMDSSVVVPITDKISEEMVNSGKYTVLDRASVEQVLKEKEFQLSSGLVKTEEIRKAGEYLGADFVVAARASKVGNTWFLSARMIDVKTGAITAQTSVEQQGNIDVLLRLAKAAGTRLAGGVVEKVAEAKFAAAGGEEKAKVEKKTTAARTKTAPAAPARWVVGAKVGGGWTNARGDDDLFIGRYPVGRLAAGAYLSRALSRTLAVETGIYLAQKGFEGDWIDGSLPDDVTSTFTFNYLEVPLLVKLNLHARSGFYAGLGAFASLLMSAVEDYDYLVFDGLDGSSDFTFTNSFDFGPLVAAGFDLPIRSGLVLNMEARLTLGLSDFFDTSTGLPPLKNAALAVLVGIGKPFGTR